MTNSLGQALIFAFTNGEQGGNPAFVIATSGRLPDLQQECIATAQKYACEVTHIHFTGDATPANLRFYVASGPIAFCGHGSLAATAWAVRAGLVQDTLQIDYGSGQMVMQIENGGQKIGCLEQAGATRAVKIGDQDLASIRSILGLPELQAHEVKLWVGGRQRAKALIWLARRELLQTLKLDPAARDRFCQRFDVTGIYPYVNTAPGRIAARHFPWHSGDSEDMATGNIAATMACHVATGGAHGLVIEQGGATCNAARLQVQPLSSGWLVSGTYRFADLVT